MATVSVFTFTSDTETVTKTKLNNLVANLVTDYNGNIDSSNLVNRLITLVKMELGTQGDLLYYTTGGIPIRLSAGTADQILKTNGASANPEWSSFVGFLGTSESNGVLRTQSPITYTDNTDYITLGVDLPVGSTSQAGILQASSDNFSVTSGVFTVKDDGITAEEISGLTGTGAVTTDNIPEGSTNLYNISFFVTALNKTAGNVTLRSVDFRNKYINCYAMVVITDDNTNWTSTPVRVNPSISTSEHSAPGLITSYSQLMNLYSANGKTNITSGFFFSGIGVSTPALGAGLANSSFALLNPVSPPSTNQITPSFVYADSITGYLSLHVGNLAAGYYLQLYLSVSYGTIYNV